MSVWALAECDGMAPCPCALPLDSVVFCDVCVVLGRHVQCGCSSSRRRSTTTQWAPPPAASRLGWGHVEPVDRTSSLHRAAQRAVASWVCPRVAVRPVPSARLRAGVRTRARVHVGGGGAGAVVGSWGGGVVYCAGLPLAAQGGTGQRAPWLVCPRPVFPSSCYRDVRSVCCS